MIQAEQCKCHIDTAKLGAVAHATDAATGAGKWVGVSNTGEGELGEERDGRPNIDVRAQSQESTWGRDEARKP